MKLSPTSQPFDIKILAWGPPGSGKTYLPATYTRGPILAHFFDPGAHKTFLKAVQNGNSTLTDSVDYSYFLDKDHTSPSAFIDFNTTLQKLGSSGVFEDLAEKNGIYVLDSISTLSNILMNDILKKANHVGKQPQLPHYYTQSSILTYFFQTITTLPCAVYLTAHVETEKNEVTGMVNEYPAVTGKLKGKIGLYFDEIWRLEAIGPAFRVNCRGTSTFQAKSRVFSEANLSNLTMDRVFEVLTCPGKK